MRNSKIPAENKLSLLKMDERNALHLAEKTRANRLTMWFKFCNFLGKKKLSECTKEDVNYFLYQLIEGKLNEGRKLTKYSIEMYKYCVKRLFEMLDDGKLQHCVSDVKPKLGYNSVSRLRPSDLLTAREVERIVHAAKTSRDKAIIKVLFEMGLRRSEFTSIRIGDVKIDNKNEEAMISINDSKTNLRTVLVINSLPELRKWLQKHPRNHDENAPLWFTNRRSGMSKQLLNHILKRAARRAGITKRVYAHLLRHSIVTWRRKGGMQKQEADLIFGWSKKGNTYDHYSHLNVQDAYNRVRRQAGRPIVGEEEEPLKSHEQCPLCKTKYPVGYAFCEKCNLPLDNEKRAKRIKELQEQQEMLTRMEKLTEKIELLNRIPTEELQRLANNASRQGQ